MPDFYLSNIGSVGVVKDQPAHALAPAMWSDGNNVRFREGQVENAAGYILLSDYSTYLDEMYSVVNSYAGSGNWWTFAGKKSDAEKIYSVTLEGTIRDTSPASGHTITQGDQHSGGNFDGTPIIANGRSSNIFYIPDIDGSGVATELQYDSTPTNLSTKLKFDVVRPMWQHLFGLGTEVVDAAGVDGVDQGYYPRLLWFSDSADPGSVPGSWEASDAATLSRSYPDPFQSYQGALVDMVQLGQDAVVYQEGACHLATYTGQAPFIVNFRPILNGKIGAIATNCIAAVRSQHVVLTESDVIIHNTQTVESILEARLRRYLFSDMDSTYYANSFVVPNYQGKEVWICYPESGQVYPNKAIVWNYQDGTTTIRDLENGTTFGAVGKQTFGPGATDYNPADNTLVTVTSGGNPYRMEYLANYAGSPPTCLVERKGIPIEGDSKTRKLLVEVWPEMEATDVVDFYLGHHDRADDPVTWQGPFSFTAGTDHFIPVTVNGRLHAVKITWANCATVKLNRIGLNYMPLGRF